MGKIKTYRYQNISSIDEFKKIYNTLIKTNNMEKCIYLVKLCDQELEELYTLSQAIDYIQEDYYKLKDEHINIELNNYSIHLNMYTKTINSKGYLYEYDYNMDSFIKGGLLNE